MIKDKTVPDHKSGLMFLRHLKRPVVLINSAFLLLVVGFFIYAGIAENRAEQNAHDFCSQVKTGAPGTGLIDKAMGAGAEQRYLHWKKISSENENELLLVVFIGATPFDRHICAVEATNQIVVSSKYSYSD